MAVRYPNFGEIEPTHYADLLPELMAGYKRGREPHKIRQEEQARELANRINETHAQYLPEQYQTGIEHTKQQTIGETARNKLQERFGERKEENAVKESELRAEKLEDEIAYAKKYNPLLADALIDQRNAAAEKSRNPKQDAKQSKLEQALAAAGVKEGSPEWVQANRVAAGLPSGRATPPNTRPLEDMPVNERLDTVKRMRNVVNSYGKVKQVQFNINEMRTIIDDNPGIAGSLAAAFIDPHDPGVKHLVASAFTKKKDKIAIQKMIKLASDINLQELSSFGNNVTDARQKLIAEGKANPNLEPETIIYVLDKLQKQKEPYDAFVEATKEGLNGNYEVYDDPEAFRIENMTPEQLEWYKEKLKAKGRK